MGAAIPLEGYPLGVAFTPDGDFAYVSQYLSSVVSVIDTRTLKVVATTPVGLNPGNIAITPDGGFAYVLSIGSSPVSVIDTESNTVVATIDVSTGSLSIAITPDGDFAYVRDAGDDNVSVVDTKTNAVVAEIPLAGGPSGIAITPDGKFVLVEDSADISVIDTKTNGVVDTIPVVGVCGPTVAITPDGGLAYAADYCNNRVLVISTRSREVVATLDGAFLYVVNNDCPAFPCTTPGIVSVVDTATNHVVDRVKVGFNPQDVAFTRKHRHNQQRDIQAEGLKEEQSPTGRKQACLLCAHDGKPAAR